MTDAIARERIDAPDPIENACAVMTSAVIDCRENGISDWHIILALLATAGSTRGTRD